MEWAYIRYALLQMEEENGKAPRKVLELMLQRSDDLIFSMIDLIEGEENMSVEAAYNVDKMLEELRGETPSLEIDQ
jgi:hypothetical protein